MGGGAGNGGRATEGAGRDDAHFTFGAGLRAARRAAMGVRWFEFFVGGGGLLLEGQGGGWRGRMGQGDCFKGRGTEVCMIYLCDSGLRVGRRRGAASGVLDLCGIAGQVCWGGGGA